MFSKIRTIPFFAHGLLGEILILKGEPSRAEEEFRLATTLKPDWSTPWINWVTLKLSQQKAEEAQAILQRGLQTNPQNEDLRFLLATHLGERGQIDQAIAEYETILKQNPRALPAANNLASLLADFKGDSQEFGSGAGPEPRLRAARPQSVFSRHPGVGPPGVGHQDDALRVIQRAVADAPQHPVLNYHLGVAHYKAGHRKEAVTHLQKALNAKQPFPASRMLAPFLRK